jgi:hypothetical protein
MTGIRTLALRSTARQEDRKGFVMIPSICLFSDMGRVELLTFCCFLRDTACVMIIIYYEHL